MRFSRIGFLSLLFKASLALGFPGVAVANCSALLRTPNPEIDEAVRGFRVELVVSQPSIADLSAKLSAEGEPYANFRVASLVPQIHFFRFPNQRELTRTFLRFQEHYESPEFHGQVFSLKEFKAWYRTQSKTGKFTYFTDWAGFNFPSSNLQTFFEGRFKNLTKREKVVLDEQHAYLMNDWGGLVRREIIPLDSVRGTIRELNAAFEAAYARHLNQ